MRLRRLLWILTTIPCLASLGCALGPQVKTEYVIVEPGKPVEVLQNVRAQCRQLEDGGQAVQQDLGGWVSMPKKHWDVIKSKLEKTADPPTPKE